MIVAAVVTLYVKDPVQKQPIEHASDLRGALGSSWRTTRMRLLLVGTLLAALLQTQMFTTFSIYMTDEIGLHKADVGLLYMLNGLGVLALQLPAVSLVRRLGVATILPWASLLDALGFALIGLATGSVGGAVAIITITAAEVVLAPAHQTAIAEVADPQQRGRAYGVVGFSQMVGIAVAPLIGGILFDAIGHHHVTMWSLIACIGIAQAVCFAAFVRKV
jgi:predicted MFS family arabinose efflux permease